jgi:hypothetical protein
MQGRSPDVLFALLTAAYLASFSCSESIVHGAEQGTQHSLAAFSPWPNLTEAYWMEKLENLTPGPRVSRQNSKGMFAVFRSHAA